VPCVQLSMMMFEGLGSTGDLGVHMAPRPMSPLNKGDGVVEGVKLYLVLLQVCQPFVGDLPRRCRVDAISSSS
jgi:hypothetical protein